MTAPSLGRTRRGLLVLATDATAAAAGCGFLSDDPDLIEASAPFAAVVRGD